MIAARRAPLVNMHHDQQQIASRSREDSEDADSAFSDGPRGRDDSADSALSEDLGAREDIADYADNTLSEGPGAK